MIQFLRTDWRLFPIGIFWILFFLSYPSLIHAEPVLIFPHLPLSSVSFPDWAVPSPERGSGEIVKAREFHSSGLRLHQDRKYKEAADQFVQSVRLNPDEARVWFDLAVALIHVSDSLQKAEDALMVAIQLDPHFEEAYNRLSTVRCSLGKCGGWGGAASGG